MQYQDRMKYVLSVIVMLALVAAMTVHGGQSSGQASGAEHVHTDMATDTITDMFADCCDVADGQIHHAMGGCALAFVASEPLIAFERDMTDTKLQIATSGSVPDGFPGSLFRPPIAA